MTKKSESDPIRTYYLRQKAPPSLVTRLAGEAREAGVTDADVVAHHSPGLVRMRWWQAAACIAMVAGISVTTGYFWGSWRGQSTDAPTSSRGPRLVAVRIQADWCVRCPLIAPTYEELIKEHASEPLLFVTLDITDDERRRQSQRLVESLGIDEVFEAPFESGMIKLIDRRDERVLSVLTDRAQKQNLEIVLAKALDDGESSR